MDQKIALVMCCSAALAACNGSQIGQVTGGRSPTGGVVGLGIPALSPVIGSGYPTLVNPCELDVDLGSIAVGIPEASSITIENQGTGVLDIGLGTPMLDPAFSLTPPSSGQIKPGASLEIDLNFMPTVGGSFSSSFVIQTDGVNPACATTGGQGSSLTINLTGTGTQTGLLAVNPSAIDFGRVLIGTTEHQSVMLSNTSTADVESITCPVGGQIGAFTVDDCPSALKAGASIQVGISYTPGGTSGFVHFNGSGGATTLLSLQGEPVMNALTLDSLHLDFGYLPPGSSVVECFTVSNEANLAYAVEQADLDFQDAGAFALSATDDAMPPNPIVYPLNILPGGSAKICYRFAPTDAQTQYYGEATLATTDPSRGDGLSVGFNGWGGGPQLNCLPKLVDFGPSPINMVQSLPVTCTNTGTNIPGKSLTIGAPTASPRVFSASFDLTTNPYPAAGLAPGQSAQIDAIYLPTAVGTDTGTLVIPSNGGQGKGVSIPLTGQGTN